MIDSLEILNNELEPEIGAENLGMIIKRLLTMKPLSKLSEDDQTIVAGQAFVLGGARLTPALELRGKSYGNN